MPPPIQIATDPRQAKISFGLLALVAIALTYTICLGALAGWYDWLPGSMSRHRDAQAVAITAVAYGEWQGFASYRSVNRALREHGLSVQSEDLGRIGAKHYFDVMTDATRLNAALGAAAALHQPLVDGMYYSQDEKGMALFFTAAFRIFGISSASWYWLYVSLYSFSVLIMFIAYWKRIDVLFLLLVLTVAHATLARMLPDLPRQDINVIHGNRFLGVMASVAMCHLMFLLLLRVRPSGAQLALGTAQVVIICLIVNARTSVAWILIAIVLLWCGIWIAWLIARSRGQVEIKPVSWPVFVIALGLAGLTLQNRFVQDLAYRDGRAHGGHVFWHNLATALHNNPLRTARYGIPKDFPVYDDQVSYLLFEREILQRGETRSKYLMGDSDWIYRTSSPDLDFRWELYDRVVRDIVVRTVSEDPGYAARSFFVQQPLSALRISLGPGFLLSRKVLDLVPLLTFVMGVLLAGGYLAEARARYATTLTVASVCVMLPVLVAAVAELRVIELFYFLLVDVAMVTAVIAGAIRQRGSVQPCGGPAA